MPPSPTTPILPRSEDGPAPCSSAQRRLWFLQQLAPASASAYNVAAAFRVTGQLDGAAFRTALAGLVARHEALRTRIVDVRGEPRQLVLPRVEPPIGTLELDPTDRDQDDRLRALLGSALSRPFDPGDAPLFRVVVVRTGADQRLLGFSFSHLVCDGWSLGLFFDELDLRYAAATAGEPLDLAPLPVQYADFATWEAERQRDPAFAAELSKWADEYVDAPVVVPPADRPRPPIQRFRGARRLVPLPQQLAAGVRMASRSSRATTSALYLAAYQVLLARWSGQGEVIIGMPVAGRTRTELEPVIGFFASTAPLRVGLSGETTGVQAVRAAGAATHRALARSHLPFEVLVERVQPERNLQRNPVFQCFFAYQNAPDRGLRLAGLAIERFPVPFETTKFDLTLEVFDTPAGSRCVLEYNSDIFLASTIDRFAAHYLNVLESLATGGDRPVSAIALAGPEELERVRKAFNDTAVRFSCPATLDALIAAQAARTPAATALVTPDGSLRYAELWARAGALARLLRERGVGPESVVAVCLERSGALVVALLGILAAGGAYLPLDPEHPRARVAGHLSDAGARVVVTTAALAARLSLNGTRSVVLLDDHDLPAGPPAGSWPCPHPDNLAYVIFTSGSTGVPKGVMISHRAIVNRIAWMQAEYRLTAGDRVLQKTPYTFDVSVWELFWPLCVGASLVVAPPGTHRDPAELAALLAERAVTVTHFVPTVLAEFLAADPPPLPALRMVFCSGEELPADLSRRLRERFPARVHNLYGPTEAAVDVTYHDCAVEPWRAAVPIGRPVANTTAYVLDDRLEAAPVGVAGELYLGGVQLARGYLGRPELTAARFLPDPIGAEPGGRLYRTGDRARWLDSGELEFLGRADGQVKLRGQRIELGEVEAALRRHPEVGNAVAAVRKVDGRDALVGYVTLTSTPPDSTDALSGMVDDWRRVWEEIYTRRRAPAEASPTVQDDFAGWVSSYTGAPIPDEEMREFVSTTVDRIRALAGNRLLEIGAGSGLLLHRLAGACAEYWATDLSEAAVARLAAEARADPALGGRVRVLHREAADLEGIPSGYFDGVIVNSVVQYFPSLRYLERVVRAALDRVREGGYVFIGDVRSYRLLRLFHAAVCARRAPAGLPAGELAARVASAVGAERELLVDPIFFARLARSVPGTTVGHALRAGRAHNEMTQFRYDLVLRRGRPRASTPLVRHAWPTDLSSALAASGRDGRVPRLVRQVPNARVAGAAAVLAGSEEAGRHDRTVDELLARASQATARAVDPDDVWREARRQGVEVAIGWSGLDGSDPRDLAAMDLLARPAGSPDGWLLPGPEDTTADALGGNDPGLANRLGRVERELRERLATWLPRAMVPAALCFLPSLPVTASGKVDRRRLPEVGPRRADAASGYLPPRDQRERIVAEVWGDLLRVDRIGVQDNFFALGGDSILAVQAVTRLRERGLDAPLRAFFEEATVERIAATARHITREEVSTPDRLPLTTVQADLLEAAARGAGPVVLCSLRRPRLHRARLDRALRALVRAQPALRLRLATGEDPPAQYLAGAGEELATASAVRWRDDSADAIGEIGAGVDATAGRGLLLTVVDRPASGTQDLYLAVDRLLVDGDSLIWLADTLDQALEASTAEEVPAADRKVTERLAVLARAGRGHRQRASGPGRSATGRSATAGLGGEAGLRLARSAVGRYRCTAADLLTAALGGVLAAATGAARAVVDVQFADPAAPAGLAGPFEWRVGVALSADDQPIARLVSAKRQLRAAISGEPAAPAPTDPPGLLLRLRDLRVDGGPERGNADHPAATERWTRLDQEPSEPLWSAYGTVVLATVSDTGLTVSVTCRPGSRCHADPARLLDQYLDGVRRLSEALLDEVLDLYIAADFPVVDLPPPALAELGRRHPDLEDLYPLTPMQRHAVTRLARLPDDGLYTISVTFTLTDRRFDAGAFARTWHLLMRRHAALRTCFVDLPGVGWLQAVRADPPLPIGFEDLRSLPDGTRSARLETLQRAARSHRFDLTECPQWRMDVLRLGEDDYRIVCRLSYALQDGWSFSVLQEEWFAAYEEAVAGRRPRLPPAPALRDHVAWVDRQDPRAAEAYWRAALEGLAGAGQVLSVPLRERRGAGPAGAEERPYQSRHVRVGRLLEQRLRAAARSHHLTLFTLLEAGWAGALARFTGRSKVAFGTVSSGRSHEVAGYERIFGPLNTVLPVVVDVSGAAADPVAWLRRLQHEHTTARGYDYASVADMARWLGRAPGDPVVDNFLVFENFPRQAMVDARMRDWRPDSGETQTEHAVRLLTWPTSPLTVYASYYRDQLDGSTVAGLLEGLLDSLAELAAGAGPGVRR